MLIDIGFRAVLLFGFLFYIEYWRKHGEIRGRRLFIKRRGVGGSGGLKLSGWRMHFFIFFVEIFLVVPAVYWGITFKTIVWNLGALVLLGIVACILHLLEGLHERKSRSRTKARPFVQEPPFLRQIRT